MFIKNHQVVSPQGITTDFIPNQKYTIFLRAQQDIKKGFGKTENQSLSPWDHFHYPLII